MLKKVMLGTVLSAVLFSGATAQVKPGFYAGVAVGASKNQGTGKATYVQGVGAGSVETPSFKQTASGFVGQVFAGYEAPLSSSFVLGGEFAVSMDTAQSKKTWVPDAANGNFQGVDDFRKNVLTQKYKLGASVNAGVPVGDCVTIYGKLGVVNGRFSLKHENNGGQAGTAGYNGGTTSKNVWGVEPGVRVKVAMSHEWAVQFDANYAMYQGFKTKNYQILGGDVAQVKVTPKIWTFLVGLSYKF